MDSARTAGARVVARADLPTDHKGHFCAPALLADVPRDADIVTQETFGPVVPVITWRAEDELLRTVNDAELGLAAYVYAGELQHAVRLGEAIDAGMVGINRGVVSDPSAPFGGLKQSGIGREGGHDGLHQFTETQYLSLDWPDA